MKKKSSDFAVIGIGSLTIACVAGLSFFGARTVTNSIYRNHAVQAVAVQNARVDDSDEAAKQSKASSSSSETGDAKNSEKAEEAVTAQTLAKESNAEKAKAQQEWAAANGIRWDENGVPVDVNNVPQDDPTTVRDESKLEAADRAVGEAGPKEDPNAAVEAGEAEAAKADEDVPTQDDAGPKWYEGAEGIELDEEGKPYYTIQGGDFLSAIANRYGFTIDELVDENEIENKSHIVTGHRIYFPEKGGNVLPDGQTGQGAG